MYELYIYVYIRVFDIYIYNIEFQGFNVQSFNVFLKKNESLAFYLRFITWGHLRKIGKNPRRVLPEVTKPLRFRCLHWVTMSLGPKKYRVMWMFP